MTVEELHEKYGFDKEITVEELMERQKSGQVLNPIYHKHLPACWVIQDVWGHVHNENISLGKARELTSAIIEEHNKLPNHEEAKKLVDDFINEWHKSNPTLDKDFYWSGVNDGVYLLMKFLTDKRALAGN